jgi:hypothetical protein
LPPSLSLLGNPGCRFESRIDSIAFDRLQYFCSHSAIRC